MLFNNLVEVLRGSPDMYSIVRGWWGGLSSGRLLVFGNISIMLYYAQFYIQNLFMVSIWNSDCKILVDNQPCIMHSLLKIS